MTRRLSQTEQDLYSRNILIPEIGEAGQIRLLESRVLVIGLGGLGSPALFYLASAGVGTIGIAEGDAVDLSNLQRQILHGRSDVGRPKINSAIEAVQRLNPDVSLEPHGRVLADNILDIIAPYDFVIEATDNFAAKFLVNDACVKLGKPFSHAGILGTYGQTMTVIPGGGPCVRCVFEKEPKAGSYETTDQAGVLGGVAGVIGTIQSIEAIKFIVGAGGLLTGRLMTFDALAMTFREVALPWNRKCALCEPRQDAGLER